MEKGLSSAGGGVPLLRDGGGCILNWLGVPLAKPRVGLSLQVLVRKTSLRAFRSIPHANSKISKRVYVEFIPPRAGIANPKSSQTNSLAG